MLLPKGKEKSSTEPRDGRIWICTGDHSTGVTLGWPHEMRRRNPDSWRRDPRPWVQQEESGPTPPLHVSRRVESHAPEEARWSGVNILNCGTQGTQVKETNRKEGHVMLHRP